MEFDRFPATLEISPVPGCDNAYSVKLNGVEISHLIKGLSLDLSACRPANLLLSLNTEKVTVSSECLLEIPEPYASYIQHKNKEGIG